MLYFVCQELCYSAERKKLKRIFLYILCRFLHFFSVKTTYCHFLSVYSILSVQAFLKRERKQYTTSGRQWGLLQLKLEITYSVDKSFTGNKIIREEGGYIGDLNGH